MADVSDNKVSPYDLREIDFPLLDAALELGDWLLRQSETTAEQSHAITLMVDFLQCLPTQPRVGFAGEFGFSYVMEDEFGAHCGSWAVSVCGGMFEMFSTGRDESEEFSWLLCPGRPNTNELHNATLWISQLKHPRSYPVAGSKFTIDASIWETSNDEDA